MKARSSGRAKQGLKAKTTHRNQAQVRARILVSSLVARGNPVPGRIPEVQLQPLLYLADLAKAVSREEAYLETKRDGPMEDSRIGITPFALRPLLR